MKPLFPIQKKDTLIHFAKTTIANKNKCSTPRQRQNKVNYAHTSMAYMITTSKGTLYKDKSKQNVELVQASPEKLLTSPFS